MFPSKDYSSMTLDELVSEEKKADAQKTITAALIGVLVGVAIYTATHKSSGLTFMLLIAALLIGSRYTQNLKSIRAELSRRDTDVAP